jgi:predicted ATPase
MKIVITGGPCSGKTTLVDRLKEKGYPIITESAREAIIDKNYSKHLDRYPHEALLLQLDIYRAQLQKETCIDNLEKTVFLDRGYIDIQVYSQHLLGYIPSEIKNTTLKRYDCVMVLDRIPFIYDGLRRENDFQASMLHEDIILAYKKNGYNPIILSATNVDDRVRKVLQIAKILELKKTELTNLVLKPMEE